MEIRFVGSGGVSGSHRIQEIRAAVWSIVGGTKGDMESRVRGGDKR